MKLIPARQENGPTIGVVKLVSSNFADLGTPNDLVRALSARGIDTPFPVQELTLADGLAGRDVSGRAPTGSGKTLAFGIPLAVRLSHAKPRRPLGLVLVPTRELAAQVAGELEWIGGPRKLRVATVYGGVGYGPQRKALKRGVDVLVACPGRLGDLVGTKDVVLDSVEMVVLDEADRMADMGFLPEVRKLLDLTPSTRQTLLFSATLDGAIDTLVQRYQRDPVRHQVADNPDHALNATHYFWKAEGDDRIRIISDVARAAGTTIVFCRTKRNADRVTKRLDQTGLSTATIHGGRSQGQRERALRDFTDGRVEALVATDVAARGIHIDSVACVVHYDPPADTKDYTHRSGRTARAGSTGIVVSLVSKGQHREVSRLQRALKLPSGIDPPNIKELSRADKPAATGGTTNQSGSFRSENKKSERPRRERNWKPEHKRNSQPSNKSAGKIESSAGPTISNENYRSSNGRSHGVIRWFNVGKGFGFIAPESGGDDLFVHFSAIEGTGHKTLKEGQRVEFAVGPGRKGEEARTVKVV